MNRSIERKMLVGYSLVFLGVLIQIVMNQHVSTQRIVLGASVDHTKVIMAQIERTLLSTTDVETEERGFLIDRDARALNTVQHDIALAWQQFQLLQSQTRDNPAQQFRLNALRPMLEDRFTRFEKVILLTQQGHLDAARRTVLSVRDKQEQSAVRAGFAAMDREEDRLLLECIAASDAYVQRSNLLLLSLRLALLGILTAVFLAVRATRRQHNARYLLLAAAEKRVQELARLQSAILDSANVSIISTDVNGMILTMNATAERWLGYSADTLIGKTDPSLFHDPQEVVCRAEVLTAELGRTILPGFEVFTAKTDTAGYDEHEWTYLRKDGSRFTVRLGATALRDDQGAILGYLGIAYDITAQKAAQGEQAKLAAIVEYAQEFIAIASLTGELFFVNPAGRKMIGVSETEDITTLHVRDISTEDSARATLYEIVPAMQKHGVWRGTGQLRNRQTGEVIEVAKTSFLIRHPQTGEPLFMASTQHDVTAQREAEQALRDSETLQRLIFEEAAAGMKLLALDGTVLRANRAFCAMLGYAPEEVIGRHFRDFTHPDDLAWNEDIFSSLLGGEIGEASLEKRCVHQDGSVVHVLIKKSVLHDSEGRLHSISSQVINITERKQGEEALRESERMLDEAQQIAKIGNWELDVATGKVKWSKELFHLYGLDPTQGFPDYAQAVACYTPEDAARVTTAVQRAIEEGIPFALDLRGAEREDCPVRWYYAIGRPIFDAVGRVVRLGGTAMEITERKRAEETLRATGERLALATEAGEMGVWELDVASGKLQWDSRKLAIYGYTEETFSAVCDAWQLRLHPEDKEKTVAALMETITQGKRFDAEFRIVLPNGEVRYIKSAAVAALDAAGKPQRIIGIDQDITARKQAERMLERLHHQNRLLLDSIGEGIYGIDLGGRCTFVNPAAAAMLGYTPEELLGQNMHDLLHHTKEDGTSYPLEECPIYRVLQGGDPSYVSDEVFWCKEGMFLPVEYFSTPVYEEGELTGLVVSFTDMTERRQHLREMEAANLLLEEHLVQVNEQAVELEHQKDELERINVKLEAIATTDGLTGIKNHRAFQEQLKTDLERSSRYGEPLSLLMMDVDKFKAFNDTHGHPSGDKVLKNVAQILQNVSRECDFAARYGGEEFVIILPETDAAGAMEAAERFRSAIEAYPWEERQITVSIGVSTLGVNVATQVDLIEQADRALYRSKEGGRNRATHAREVSEETEAQEVSKSINTALLEIFAARSAENPFAIEDARETMVQAYDATVESWCRIVDMKDRETEGHSERVTDLMVRLADYVGMNADEAHYARWGALLHDIGKMAVPDAILLKPGPLDEAEWVIMREHPGLAQEMLCGISFLGPALEIPYCHHEKWDGSGYPRGLKGEEIPFAARLFAVIDVYDALVSDRPYRSGWPVEKVREHLLAEAGTHFDPRAVRAFLAMLDAEAEGTCLAA